MTRRSLEGEVLDEILHEDPDELEGWRVRERPRLPLFSTESEVSVDLLRTELWHERALQQVVRQQIMHHFVSAHPHPTRADVERRLVQLERTVSSLQAEVRALTQSQSKATALDSHSHSIDINEVSQILTVLLQFYEIENAGPIVQHFIGRPELVTLFVDAAPELERLFESRPALKSDSDGDLVLEISTMLVPSIAEDKYSEFIQKWWLPRARGVASKTKLTINYCSE